MRYWLLILLFFGCAQQVMPQARVRVRPDKFDPKPIAPEENKEPQTDPKSRFNMADRGNEVDEFFYIKWAAGKPLSFVDFMYDRSYQKQLIPEKDTDLLKSVYPNYQSFYNMLSKRNAADSMEHLREDSLRKQLNAQLGKLYAGSVYSASVDLNLSFEKNIDSPAASVLTISPAIYAVNDTMFYYNIVALFSKYESWMIIKSKDILQHEQIHFDIFEIYARKLRKYWVELLKNATPGSSKEITSELAPAYEKIYQQLYNMQAKFDEETAQLTAINAPLNELNATWDRVIKAELEVLKDYANPEGTIILKRQDLPK